MNALVVPSIRPEQLTEFFDAWAGRGGWDQVYVTEDAEGRSPAMAEAISHSDKPVMHLCHSSSKILLGPDKARIISKKDSACRSLGMYAAWLDGAEYILTLDDDVRPVKGNGMAEVLARHIDAMTRAPRFKSSVQGLWPRGMPDVKAYRIDVKASMGLWRGVPDLYAEDMLRDGKPWYTTDYVPPLGSRILPDGEFVPICGMNFCIHRDAMPLCWFPLMGEGYPYSRFDDIWAGLILKRGFDLMRWKISIGEPHIHHSRASDPVKCAERERSGKGPVNDSLWQAMLNPYDGPIHEAKDATRDIMFDLYNLAGSTGNGYWYKVAKGMQVWSSLFEGSR